MPPTRNPANWLSGLTASPRVLRLVAEPILRLKGFRKDAVPARLAAFRRILVLRTDEIGDFVMTTPFLRELRRNCPESRITLVVKPGVLNLAETCPYVDEVRVFDPNASSPVRWRRLWRAWRLARRHLWERRFDAAILPRWDADVNHATYVAYLSGAACRVGYSEKVSAFRRRENRGYDRLLTCVLTDSSCKHEVEHGLDVLRALGGTVTDDRLEVWLRPEDERFAAEALAGPRDAPAGPLVAFALGSREGRKRWPVKRFAEVARWMALKHGARTVVLLGPGEEHLECEWKQFGHSTGPLALRGQTLRQTAAVLKHCRLLVGNDSGPKHLAAAMGVPVVEVSPWLSDAGADVPGAGSPLRFGSWRVPHRVVSPSRLREPCVVACAAAEPHCILGVGVEDVCGAVEDLWREQALPAGGART
jgi:ADP-heptose:LPS heptosyltransferase